MPCRAIAVDCFLPGRESSDVRRKTIREFLPATQVRESLELGRSLGCTPIVYTVDGVVTDAGSNGKLNYTELSGHRPVAVSTTELLAQDVFKVIWMGEPETISGVKLPTGQSSAVQAVRTHARILEFMPSAVSKGAALAALAGSLGIDGSEAVVFGDGENDIPMFNWAGTSVAMPHGWTAAIRQATHVAPSGPMETALARGVEMVLGILE